MAAWRSLKNVCGMIATISGRRPRLRTPDGAAAQNGTCTEQSVVNPNSIDASGIRTENGRTLLSAWQNWRGAELLPSRENLRLTDVTALMPFLIILEICTPDVFTVRLAGTAISAAIGGELTGKNYLDLTTPDLRPLRSARVWRQAQQPCGSVILNVHGRGLGNEYRMEVLSLPVRPVEASRPLQFLSIVALVDPGALRAHEIETKVAEMADEFAYLDLGAGVPADPALEMALVEA